jgi:hypothetical protein
LIGFVDRGDQTLHSGVDVVGKGTLGKVDDEAAKAAAGRIDYLLMRIRQRLIEVPAGVGIITFVDHVGSPRRLLRGRRGRRAFLLRSSGKPICKPLGMGRWRKIRFTP